MLVSSDVGRVVLVSCYELGHQPLSIAFASAFLAQRGYDVRAFDLAVERFDPEACRGARLIAISVPMHTALRIGVGVAQSVRARVPDARICFFGLYAAANADYLLRTCADFVIAGEVEEALAELVDAVVLGTGPRPDGVTVRGRSAPAVLKRLAFPAPDRSVFAPLDRYVHLHADGELKAVGYTETTRGCLHHCTHCPIPPVYDGRFFAIPAENVLADVRALVAGGAEHITFGDPDFLNGPTHALRVARGLHAEFPRLSFDFTTKVEHVLKYGEQVRELGSLGGLFLTSAFESTSDACLEALRKHHTRADLSRALHVVRDAGMDIRPTWVAFTPWTTLSDYVDMLRFIEQNDLVASVEPIQMSIRLLIPPKSLLLDDPAASRFIEAFDEPGLSYRWRHPDPRMDDLCRRIGTYVEQADARGDDEQTTFRAICALAFAEAGLDYDPRSGRALAPYRVPPRLTESWFC